MSAVILGLDPGTRITGFGVLRLDQGRIEHINHGVILLDEKSSIPLRMKELSLSLREVLQKYHPQHVVIEKIFLGKNADSAFKLGHARGVIMAESCISGAEVYEYATRSVKKGVTGSGGASKEEVQMVLQTLLNLKAIRQIDASDALAMACHHIYEERKRAIMERAVSI